VSAKHTNVQHSRGLLCTSEAKCNLKHTQCGMLQALHTPSIKPCAVIVCVWGFGGNIAHRIKERRESHDRLQTSTIVHFRVNGTNGLRPDSGLAVAGSGWQVGSLPWSKHRSSVLELNGIVGPAPKVRAFEGSVRE
jgi:hypothetical protein